MSLHDDYARLTPFEIAFPDRTAVAALSAEVAEEAKQRGVDDGVPETFITLLAVGELVRRMRGPDAPPESTYPFGALLYHGVHFLRGGCPLYLLETGATRRLVLAVPDAARGDVRERDTLDPPSVAGYLQLPQHLLWTGGAATGGTPESLDGVFWTLSRSGMLHALPISGVLPDRPGFGAMPLPPAPIADAHAWLGAQARASGDDFASNLPGGDLDELYSVETAGEVLKLLARFFAVADGGEARFDARPGASAPDAGRPAGGPRPSKLPYTRVSLAD
jgi:hypothetical protein